MLKRDSSTNKQNSSSLSTESVKQDENVETVDEVYEIIKGNNNFGWFYALPLGLGYSLSLAYITPYLKQIPALMCSDGIHEFTCSRQYA